MLGLEMDGFFFFPFLNELISRNLSQLSLLTYLALPLCALGLLGHGAALGYQDWKLEAQRETRSPASDLPSCRGYLGYFLQSRQGVQLLPPSPTNVMCLAPAMSTSPLNNQRDGSGLVLSPCVTHKNLQPRCLK